MDEMEINISGITQAIIMLEEKDSEGRLLDKNELVQAYKMRGLTYMQTECLSEAFDDYNKALELINDTRESNNHVDENLNAEIYGLRGILHFMSGEFDSALPDFRNCIKIWDILKNNGMPVNEELLENVRGIAAGITAFSSGDKDEALEHYKKGIEADEALKNSNQSYDKSGLANKYYFAALNYMQKEENKEAIASLSKCIELFSEIGMSQINSDDIKILSSAYMCRGELYFQIDEDDDALDDYNSAVAIEELLQKNGVEMNDLDTLDVIRLYTGRARVLDYLGKAEGAIDDFITALRLNKPVFNEFPDAQEEYYFYLDKLVDCMIEESVSIKRFNDIMQEFMYPLIHVEKTEEADEKQNIILNKIRKYIE